MRIFVYPHTYKKHKVYTGNPYILDFIEALKSHNYEISNELTIKHPLWSLLKFVNNSDIFIFHWLENVPLYKYGIWQFIFSWITLPVLRLKKKKIIWFRHNYIPHNVKSVLKRIMCAALIKRLKSKADIIITHSEMGLDDLEKEKDKSFYFIHPTKNRGILPRRKLKYDLLIWGTITRYKGVLDFLQYNFNVGDLDNCKIRIIGKCSDKILLAQINSVLKHNVSFENRRIEFDEVKNLVSETKYVILPYTSESVLSSGILMDSLSVGASIIGPNLGAFKDLSDDKEVNVRVYNSFSEIPTILNTSIPNANYPEFLSKHSWQIFSTDLQKLISNILR